MLGIDACLSPLSLKTSLSYDRWRNRVQFVWKKLDHISVWFALLHAWHICLLHRTPKFFPITIQVWPRFATSFGYLIDKVGWDCCTVWFFSHSRKLNHLHETAYQFQFNFSLSLYPSLIVSVEYFWSSILSLTSYTSLCHLIPSSSLNHLSSHHLGLVSDPSHAMNDQRLFLTAELASRTRNGPLGSLTLAFSETPAQSKPPCTSPSFGAWSAHIVWWRDRWMLRILWMLELSNELITFYVLGLLPGSFGTEWSP
jgi:hypothetical protein